MTESVMVVWLEGRGGQLGSVTINGTNDVPTIGGTATGTVTEDVNVVAGNLATSGALTISRSEERRVGKEAQISQAAASFKKKLPAHGACTYPATASQTATQH